MKKFFLKISDKTKKVLEDIFNVKIQGAENIAFQGSKSFYEELKIQLLKFENKNEGFISYNDYKKIFFYLKNKFLSLRKTEPHLENNILFLEEKKFNRKKISNIIKNLDERMFFLEEHHKNVYDKIGFFSKKELSKFNVFYTHCHSSMAVKAILSSNPKVVYNTETRPLFQGRKTALELSDKVVVKHFVDSYMSSIIPFVDVVVLGSDEITEDGRIINKVGSKNIVFIAEKFNIPVYFVSDSFKLKLHSKNKKDEDLLEFRDRSEVWNINKKNLFVYNPAFEIIDGKKHKNVKIIFEEGVVSVKDFVSIAKKKLLEKKV